MTPPRAFDRTPWLLRSLRALGHPLAALGVVLVIWATVIPVVAKADGTWCIGTLGGLSPDSWAKPICDHCVPAVLPDIAPPALVLPEKAEILHEAVAANPAPARRPPVPPIRGPPSLES
ncbi:hypothetical protein [Acuticoccus kandeliae]|uniref:hypothetical protein n=1 Tax=Acuticoccus kandeliae TaxID=2073160 RepID=UPI001300AA60|nr:hypothetical protein [Acuticoccus kandeliae]